VNRLRASTETVDVHRAWVGEYQAWRAMANGYRMAYPPGHSCSPIPALREVEARTDLHLGNFNVDEVAQLMPAWRTNPGGSIWLRRARG
jgi:hypothetical protein